MLKDKRKTVAIIQARRGSSRLPDKVLKQVAGRPLLAHMIERVKRSKYLDEVWVATPQDSLNDEVERVARVQGAQVSRGSEKDVLSRYYDAAQKAGADVIVRLNADCPLMDPGVVDSVVEAYRNERGGADYASNCLKRTYPDGLDVEAFSMEALTQAMQKAVHSHFREHVTPYIHGLHKLDEKGGPFRLVSVVGPADFSHLRWTVDYKEDFELVSKLLEALLPVKPDFSWLDVVALQTKEPSLLAINGHLQTMYMTSTARTVTAGVL